MATISTVPPILLVSFPPIVISKSFAVPFSDVPTAPATELAILNP